MTSFKARLIKAKARLLGTATKDIAVPFELPCDCGHRITGIRRTSYQVATCSACDASIYVLPVNVYPATKRIRSEVLDGSIVSRLGTVVQELVGGEPDATAETAIEKKPAPADARRRTAAEPKADRGSSADEEMPKKGSRRSATQPKLSPAAAAIVADPILVEEPVVRVPRPALSVIIRRVFTPFRLLMLSAVILVAATGWWVFSERRYEEARKTFRREMDVAEIALKEKDLAALETSLTKAVAATDMLQRDDAESRRAAALLKQTLAVQNLSSTDLVTLLSGNLSVNGTLSPTKAAAAAESLAERWFVIDCGFVNSEDDLRADMPLIIDSVPVIITIRSAALRRAVAAMPQSPLLIVASVEASRLIEERSEFRIQLRSDSWSLITTEFHAEQLGFTTANTPGLDALIPRQAEFLNSAAASTQSDLTDERMTAKDSEEKP